MMSSHSGYVGADGRSAIPESLRARMEQTGEPLAPEVELMLDRALDEAVSYKELKAKYKLEIVFMEDRSMHKPFGGFVYAMSNGGYAHGGGDEAIYFCTAPVERHGEVMPCGAPLDVKWVGGSKALCPECKNLSDPKHLTGQVYAKLTQQNWVELIYRMFRALKGDADMRLGTLKGDLRRASQGEGQHAGDKLLKVRMNRSWVVYPLASLLKDISSGGDTRRRIESFIRA